MDEELMWVMISPNRLLYLPIEFGEAFPSKVPIHLPLGHYELSVKMEKGMGPGSHALYGKIFEEAGRILKLAKGDLVVIMTETEMLDYDHYAKANSFPIGQLKRYD